MCNNKEISYGVNCSPHPRPLSNWRGEWAFKGLFGILMVLQCISTYFYVFLFFYCSMFIVHCPLLTADCGLLTVYCLLLTAYCLLFTAYCSLLTAYCLLLTAYCLLFFQFISTNFHQFLTSIYFNVFLFLLFIDFHGNNNPQFYIFDLQSFA